MFDFSTIDEVRLAVGQHSSPHEGLCFMEMVAWFAGEEHGDKPPCACPVLGAYAIRINDTMPGDLRDRLLKPLVPLIVGTRDFDSENKRAAFFAMWATNKVLPITLRLRGFEKEAAACEAARTLGEARTASAAAAYAYAASTDAAAYAAHAARSAERAARSAERAAAYAYAASTDAAACAAAAAYAARRAAAAACAASTDAENIWTVAVEGLRQAILIGRHDGFADPEPVIIERRAKLRELVND